MALFPKTADGAGLGEEETGRGLVCGGQVLVPQSARVQRIDLARGERGADLQLPGGVRDSGAMLYIGKNLVIVNPQRANVFDVLDNSNAGLK